MSAALVRWGATAGAGQRASGAAQDGGGQTAAAPGMGDGVAAAISEAATLLTRDAAADSPVAVALRAAQRTRLAQEEKRRAAVAAEAQAEATAEAAASAAPSRPAMASGQPHGIAGMVREQQRWRQDHGGEPPRAAPSDRPHGVLGMSREKAQRRAQGEAERRRIADEQYQLARNEAVIAAGMMASDDGRSALVHRIVRDLGMGTEPGSERVNRNFIAERDAYYQRRARATEEQRKANEKRQQEEQRLRDEAQLGVIDEGSSTFGVAPQVLAPGFKPLRDRDAAEQKAIRNQLNDQEHEKLHLWEKTWNHMKREWFGSVSGSSLNQLRIIQEFNDRTQAVLEKVRKGEDLSRVEYQLWIDRHNIRSILVKETREALSDLAAAQAKLTQIPNSTALRKLNEARTVGDFFKVLNENFEEIVVLGAAGVAPTIAAAGAASIFTGPLGGILAAAAVAFGSGFPEAILDAFERRGIDLANEKTLLAIISDPNRMKEIYGDALMSAGIDAGLEVLGGVGGPLLKTVRRRFGGIAASGAESLAQGAVNAGGEVAKYYAIEKGHDEDGGSSLTVGRIGKAMFDGILTDRITKTLPAVGAGAQVAVTGAQTGIGRVGKAVKPFYEAYRDRNIKGGEPVDYNRSIAHFAEKAKKSEQSSKALASLISREQENRRRIGDEKMTKRLETAYFRDQKLHLSWEAADRLRKAGILTDGLASELGISKAWLDTPNAKQDAVVGLVPLLRSRLDTAAVHEFSRNVRTESDSMSAYEASAYLRWREQQLDAVSNIYRNPGNPVPDGWSIYQHVFNVARNKGRLTRDEAHRKAAEVTEYFINLALVRGPGVTADILFVQDYDPRNFGLPSSF